MAILTMYHYLASRTHQRIKIMGQAKQAWHVIYQALGRNKNQKDIMLLASMLARNLAVAEEWPLKHKKEVAGLLLYSACQNEDTLQHAGIALILLSRNDPTLEKYCLGLGKDRLLKVEDEMHQTYPVVT